MILPRRVFLQSSVALLLPALRVESAAAAGLVLVPIVASTSPMKDISLGTLRRVFLSEPVTGPGGLRLVGFNQPAGSRARDAFDRVVLGMDPDQVARYWVDQRIRGSLRPPRQVNNISLLRQVISRFPGGVGYLSPADLDPSVRPLTINGVAADAPQYPLR
ncbi:MAG: hypothetical protein RL685_6371 [Pseudomonadota bacterium]|jgi:hypothetical protein